jgi:hypothetical protein
VSTRQRPISAITLADLARAGSSIARQSLMQVNFEVHHLSDHAGYLRDVLDSRLRRHKESPSEYPLLRETLSSAANGIGLVIATYPGRLPPEMQSRRQGSSLPVELKVDDKRGARTFLGTGWPNPSFIYESARVHEGLIVIEDEPRVLLYRHGLAICELLHYLSELASENAEAPILLMQSPVQLPAHRFVGTDVRSRREDWPRFSAIAVRFAMALQNSSAHQRLDLMGRLSRFCAERGYGLWLNDSRRGHRSGNWFLIRAHDRLAARRSLDRWVRRKSGGTPSCCLPVTIVGPARVGSTHSVMSYLREFQDLGVMACSVTSLDDLAFIHLQLAINDVSPTQLPPLQQAIEDAIESTASLTASQARTSTPQDLLPTILPLVANGEYRPDPKALAYLMDRAGNYQVLAGPAMRTRNTGIENRKSLWFAWQAEGHDAGLAVPLVAFVDAVRTSGVVPIDDDVAQHDEPNIEYLVCRDVGDSILRGKGKVSLPVELLAKGGGSTLESDGPRLSASLEDAWRAELERHRFPGVGELSVAWLEHRLGPPTTPF